MNRWDARVVRLVVLSLGLMLLGLEAGVEAGPAVNSSDGSKCPGTSCVASPSPDTCTSTYDRDDGCCPVWHCKSASGATSEAYGKLGSGRSGSSSSSSFSQEGGFSSSYGVGASSSNSYVGGVASSVGGVGSVAGVGNSVGGANFPFPGLPSPGGPGPPGGFPFGGLLGNFFG